MSVEIPTVSLGNNVEMPIVGYGTWQTKDEELERALEAALSAGYRHIDTAFVYENEHVIGKVLNRWFKDNKLKREDVFLVTKLPPGGNRPEAVAKYLEKSLQNLQVDYVDLYLVHLPFTFKDVDGQIVPFTADGEIDMDTSTDHVAVWKSMEDQVKAGLTKTIGLSNFNIDQISRILKNCNIRPCNLQVELHAYFQQRKLLSFCKENKITLTAYSPLGSPGVGKFLSALGCEIDLPDILNNSTVKKIAKKYDKSEAQVLLKHIIQKGVVVIPKSATPERIVKNISLFDFYLSKDDVADLDDLDKGIRILDFSMFKGIKAHPEYPF